MGRKSTRENKTVYQRYREDLDWSRAKAAEETYISEGRLEKIEMEKTKVTPEDVVAMAEAYNRPELCNRYCVNECAVGKRLDITITKRKGLAKIVLEVLAAMNMLEEEKNRLVEIAADEQISDEEVKDFVRIQNQLESISSTAESLKLWITNAITEGSISREKLEMFQK